METRQAHESDREDVRWYLRIEDGREYGPFPIATLRDWAAKARLSPDNIASRDRQSWVPVHTLPELEMIWMAYQSGGSEFGPFNLMAAPSLLRQGTLSQDALLANKVTGKTLPLNVLIKVDALALPPESAEPIHGQEEKSEEETSPELEGIEDSTTPGESGEQQDWWFLRIAGDKVYGTFPVEAFREWAAQGRILPENEVSRDKKTWQPVHTLEGIGMSWTVQLKDGREYGPFNILAAPVLLERGIITRESVVVNKTTGKRISVSELLKAEDTSQTSSQSKPDTSRGDATSAEKEEEDVGQEKAEVKRDASLRQAVQSRRQGKKEVDALRELATATGRTLSTSLTRLQRELGADPVARLLANWHLKLDDGSIYGPATLSKLREWAAQSRIGPDCRLSVDCSQWVQAQDIPELGMDWLILEADGGQRGPFNLSVVAEMEKDGIITPDASVKHRATGKTWTVSDLPIPEFACLQERIAVLEHELAARPLYREPVSGKDESIPGRSVAAQIRQRLSGCHSGNPQGRSTTGSAGV